MVKMYRYVAMNYLREYDFISSEALVYQENPDIEKSIGS
jgi:hypothetical protein